MASHPLPEPVERRLTLVATSLEEVLQADSHQVLRAIAHHAAFNETYIESILTRALMCYAAREFEKEPGFGTIPLARGGIEFYILHAGIERRFRLKSARRDARGLLEVRSGTDSVLYAKARTLELWDDPYKTIAPEHPEPWVLTFMVKRDTLTLAEVCAARIVGVGTAGPPYRLEFDHVLPIDFTMPTPPAFPEDDERLDLDEDDDEEDGGEEETG